MGLSKLFRKTNRYAFGIVDQRWKARRCLRNNVVEYTIKGVWYRLPYSFRDLYVEIEEK